MEFQQGSQLRTELRQFMMYTIKHARIISPWDATPWL